MHNQDENHQSLNANHDADEFQPPSWLGAVKVASVVMGVMIVAGLALLGYGLATGVGKVAGGITDGGGVFGYPSGFTLTESRPAPEGGMMLMFEGDGLRELIIIDPATKTIRSRVKVIPSDRFEFIENP